MLNKIDPEILFNVNAQNSDNSKIECIVYANNYSYTKNFLSGLNLNKLIEYPFINAFGAKLNFVHLTNLAKLDEVSYIASNYTVNVFMNISKKVLNIGVGAPSYKKKPPYTVAIIDTGVDTILDLCVPQNRIVFFKDFVNNKKIPYDDNGHGTFVTSVLAGNGLVSGKKFAGINPSAFIISLKALDEKGETGVMTILEAMQWIYDNRKKYNIKVVCMSFGSGTIGKRDPLIVGAEVLWNSGVCVVVAAGNSGPGEETINSPGASTKIITVGALNDNRFSNKQYDIADFSSRGPVFGNFKPDLVAPGVNITSACNYSVFKQHYREMSGTSVATPMVAGVCSLLVGANVYLTPNEIKKILIKNCVPITYNRNAEGFGLLNCDFLKYLKIT